MPQSKQTFQDSTNQLLHHTPQGTLGGFIWLFLNRVSQSITDKVKHTTTVNAVVVVCSLVGFITRDILQWCKWLRQRNKKPSHFDTYQRIKGIITLVTNSYLSPWPHPLLTASLLWGSCHYGNHDISSMPVVRFCSREGVNEKRKWRIKREAACKGGREINEREEERERDLYSKQRGFCQRLQIPSLYRCMLPGQLQHVGLPACHPSLL